MIVAKIHQSYRLVVALCDTELVGRILEEGKRELNVRENFFKDKELSHEEAVDLMVKYIKEDATFNIVGPDAIQAAIEAGVITQDSVDTIEGIPFTLILL